MLDRPVTLDGGGAAIIDGGGAGTVVTVTGDDVTVKGLTVIGSGSDHEEIDSGIKMTKTARDPQVLNNRVLGNLYGIDIHGAKDALVAGNHVEGRQDHHMNARGNGIYLWNAPGAVVEDNTVRWGRDGIFVNSSKKNIFRNNTFRDLRFAVHYMYADNSEVSGNVSIGNHLGYAVMFSTRVKVTDNVSINDRDHGVMLNYANKSIITGNVIKNTKGKCTFIYNSHKNDFSGNWFQGCGIGIHFTAGSDNNRMVGNAFLGNRTQVKYVSTKWVEWSEDGQGNYWSDFAAYDVDGDGIADTPYRPNDSMDHVLWTQPAAKMLLGSPAVQLVRWSQASFPALLPGGVMDSHALMAPVLPAATKRSLRMADTLIVEHAEKFRGKTQVLDDICLRIAPGERVALLGHNGAGKSTLIKSILGLTPIRGGRISICGAAPGSAAARAATAFLPEAVSFHPALTGREQLTQFARLSGARADVAALLDRVGLADALDRRIGTYSKGMRQRLGLAQVLLGQPKLALLDEPTSGLDPISRQDLYAIIDELAAQGTAVLIASHALTEVEARTDRIAIMRKGVKVADDTLAALSADAALLTSIRITARAGEADRIAAQVGGTRINGASVEIQCDAAAKMEALRHVAALGDAVADVSMTPPKLEDLYRHYAKEDHA